MKKIELTEKERNMMKAMKETLTSPDRLFAIFFTLVIMSLLIFVDVLNDYAKIHAINPLKHPIELIEYINDLSLIFFIASWIIILTILIISTGLITVTVGIAYSAIRFAIPAILKWLIVLAILTAKLIVISAHKILLNRKTPPK